MKKLIPFVLIALFAVAAFGQSTPKDNERYEKTSKELAPVKAYVDGVKKFVEKEKDPHVIYADVADYNKSDKAEWAKFDSRAAYENDKRDSYTIGFVWKKDGKIVQVNMTNTSPSGDWVHYVFHTFHPNGQLAYADKELRTFMGDIIVNRRSYYDKNGKEIMNSTSYRDLATGKVVKKPEGGFQDIEVDVFMKVKKAPFLMAKSKK